MSCRSKYRAAALVSLLAGCSALAPQERDPTPVNPTAVVEIHTSSTGSRGIPAVETTTLSYTRAAMQRVESHVKGSGIFARLLYTDAQQRIERLDRNLAWVLDAKNKKAIECPLKGCAGAPAARPARQADDRAPVCRLKITESTVTAHITGRKRRINGFETDEVLDQDKRDLVYPERINPLTTKAGLPRYIDGTKTLKSGGNFPTIAERRGAIFIEQSIKGALEFARHENNNETLRSGVERSVTSFLTTQMNLGAFRTKDPKTAFFVDFGEGLNPLAQQFAGVLKGRIGLATNKPADFIELNFSQDTRALDAELAG